MTERGGPRLSYGQVESLLAEMLEVESSSKGRLVARLKSLKREGFPPDLPQRAGHSVYDLDATMKTVLVFALINSMVLPDQATALVNGNWEAIREGIDATAASLEPTPRIDLEARPEDGRYIVITPAALDHWTGRGGRDEEERPRVAKSNRLVRPGELVVIPGDRMDAAGTGTARRAVPARLLVDLWTVTAWTLDRIVASGWAEPAQLGMRG